MSFCEAIKKDGKICSYKARPNEKYCGTHKNHNKEEFKLALTSLENHALVMQGYIYINRYNLTNDLIYLIRYIKSVIYRLSSILFPMFNLEIKFKVSLSNFIRPTY